MTAFSLSALEQEREELRKDLLAFSRAYDLLQQRVNESAEAQPTRTPLLHQWSGTVAPMAALDLSLNALRRTLEEIDDLVRKIRVGEITNIDLPRLTLVEDDVS